MRSMIACGMMGILLLGQILPSGSYPARSPLPRHTLSPQLAIHQESFLKVLSAGALSALDDVGIRGVPHSVNLVISKTDNNALAGKIASQLGIPDASVVIDTHKDGESRPVVVEPQRIAGTDCLIVHDVRASARRDEDDRFVDLLFLIAGARDFNAKNIRLLLPETLVARSEDLLRVLSLIVDEIYLVDEHAFSDTAHPAVRIYKKYLPAFASRNTRRKDTKGFDIVLFHDTRARLHARVVEKVKTDILSGVIRILTLKGGRRTSVEFPPGVRDKRILLFHTTKTNRGLVQLLLALHRLHLAGAREIVTFLGYMGYARGHENYPDQRYGPAAQTVNAAKIILDLISYYSWRVAIVNAHFIKRPEDSRFWYLKDPRNFTRSPRPHEIMYLAGLEIDNLNAIDLLARYCGDHFQADNPVLVAPDEGIFPFVHSAAEKLGYQSGYIRKQRVFGKVRRDQEEVVDRRGTRVDIRGRDIIILDDIISGGATTLSAARICRETLHAGRVFAGAVHGIFAGEKSFEEKIRGRIDGVLSTDSIITRFSIVSLADLIIEYLGLQKHPQDAVSSSAQQERFLVNDVAEKVGKIHEALAVLEEHLTRQVRFEERKEALRILYQYRNTIITDRELAGRTATVVRNFVDQCYEHAYDNNTETRQLLTLGGLAYNYLFYDLFTVSIPGEYVRVDKESFSAMVRRIKGPEALTSGDKEEVSNFMVALADIKNSTVIREIMEEGKLYPCASSVIATAQILKKHGVVYTTRFVEIKDAFVSLRDPLPLLMSHVHSVVTVAGIEFILDNALAPERYPVVIPVDDLPRMESTADVARIYRASRLDGYSPFINPEMDRVSTFQELGMRHDAGRQRKKNTQDLPFLPDAGSSVGLKLWGALETSI